MASDASRYTERRRAFRRLHESGCFVIPNPWDAGSARYLQGLGFKALATTSAGCAWSNGAPDDGAGLEATLANVRAIVDGDEPSGERRLRVRLRQTRPRAWPHTSPPA